MAPIDQFHTRGLSATVEFAESLNVQRHELLIDIALTETHRMTELLDKVRCSTFRERAFPQLRNSCAPTCCEA